nr:uncharacterized protein LOC115265836 [Aedes albopictus]
MIVAEGSATVCQSQPVLGSANKRQPAAPAILSQTIISKPVPRQAPVPIPMLPVEHSGPAKTTVIPPIISTNITPEPSNPTLTNTQTNAQHFVNQADVSLFSQSEIAALLQNSQELELDSQQLPEHGEANYQEEYVMDVQPVTDSDRIIQSVTQHIEQECNRIAGIIVQKVENCLVKAVALLKSDFDVKMEAALRLQGHPPAVDSNFKFKPASTVEEIQQMEKDLGDKTYQEKLIYHMRSVIGPHDDTCNGQNSCYVMIDNFFTRTVMLECSWSGGSKTNTPKYAIKSMQIGKLMHVAQNRPQLEF